MLPSNTATRTPEPVKLNGGACTVSTPMLARESSLWSSLGGAL
jgi:hypothetical protein